MRLKKAIVTVSFVGLSFLSADCTRNNSGQPVQGQKKDTSAAVDSASPAAAQGEITLTYEQRQGKYLFTKYCAVCHGAEGKGDGFNAFNLDPKPRDFTDSVRMEALTDERILQTISGGGRSVNKSSLMPSWGGRLQKEDLKYLLAYVRTFSTANK